MAEIILLILTMPIWAPLALVLMIFALYIGIITFSLLVYIIMIIFGCFLYIIASIAKGVKTVWRKIFKNVR